MIMFKTRTGSVYVVDDDKKTWARIEEGKDKGPTPLRTTEGTFYTRAPFEIGKGAVLLADPLNPGFDGRMIYTSDIVELNENWSPS